jgi:Holliday junction resolvase RusA-like endonuclease
MTPLLSLEFTVWGVPVPQGSMKAFLPKGWDRPIVTADNKKTKPWRQEIAGAALAALGKQSPAGKNVPIRIEVRFFFPRPKSVKALDKTTRPDLDKLLRSLGDALTGILWQDDAQVTEIHACKLFGTPPRMEIKITEADVPAMVPAQSQSIKGLLPF